MPNPSAERAPSREARRKHAGGATFLSTDLIHILADLPAPLLGGTRSPLRPPHHHAEATDRAPTPPLGSPRPRYPSQRRTQVSRRCGS